jgi:hypothetical protein
MFNCFQFAPIAHPHIHSHNLKNSAAIPQSKPTPVPTNQTHGTILALHHTHKYSAHDEANNINLTLLSLVISKIKGAVLNVDFPPPAIPCDFSKDRQRGPWKK